MSERIPRASAPPAYTTSVTKTEGTLNPMLRWRWRIAGTGMAGYATTRRGAWAAVRRALRELR